MTLADPNTVTVYPAGLKIRISPDAELTPWPDHLPVPGRIGVFEWQETAPGNYQPKIRTHPKMIRMRATITEELGLGITYNSLRRLMTAGFVKWHQVTPGQYAFDLQSFYQHLAAVAADPEFWRGKNLRRYMEAIS